MRFSKFSPSLYKGKKQVYVSDPRHQGIYSIWLWNEKKQRYIQKQVGKKYCAYRKIHGRQLTGHFESFEDAKKWRESVEFTGVAHKEKVNLLFKEVAQRYFDHKVSKLQPTTVQTYISKAKHLRFFDDMTVASITPQVVDAWISAIKRPSYLETQHKSRVTYKHELSALRQILTYYSEYLDDDYQVPLKKRHNEDCIVDPVKLKLLKVHNRNKFLTREECEAFVGYLKRQAELDQKKEVFFRLAHFQFNTGTRIGEACAIDWRDVDPLSGTVRIAKTVQWGRGKGRESVISGLTKTGDSRVVPLIDSVISSLSEWKELSQRSSGLVFSEHGFAALSYRSIQYEYTKAFKALGIQATSTHILRHSFATDFLLKTQNQLALSKVLGHRNLKQTEHYAKITATTVADGVREYNQMLQGKETNLVDLFGSKSPEKLG